MIVFLCVMIIVLFSSESEGKFDPCARTRCKQSEVCKLESVLCYTIPCPGPKAVCRPKVKIGFCPPPRPFFYGPCISRCATDADCTGDNKCCGVCPRRCTAPAPAPQPKPEKCPNFSGSTLPFCEVKCTSDQDCPGNSKCCGSCPSQCTAPVRPKPRKKPGSCPKQPLGLCIATCRVDGDCPRGQKCCGGCPRSCKDPVILVKPGTCPSPQGSIFSQCQKPAQCNGDSDCLGARKCCNGCPKKCIFPTSFIEV